MSEKKTNAAGAAQEKSVAAGKTGAKPETVAYVGPTIMGVATHNQIFNNGLPDGLVDAMGKEPAFKSLVVPIGSLAAAGSDIANKTGAAYAFYKKALDYKV